MSNMQSSLQSLLNRQYQNIDNASKASTAGIEKLNKEFAKAFSKGNIMSAEKMAKNINRLSEIRTTTEKFQEATQAIAEYVEWQNEGGKSAKSYYETMGKLNQQTAAYNKQLQNRQKLTKTLNNLLKDLEKQDYSAQKKEAIRKELTKQINGAQTQSVQIKKKLRETTTRLTEVTEKQSHAAEMEKLSVFELNQAYMEAKSAMQDAQLQSTMSGRVMAKGIEVASSKAAHAVGALGAAWSLGSVASEFMDVSRLLTKIETQTKTLDTMSTSTATLAKEAMSLQFAMNEVDITTARTGNTIETGREIYARYYKDLKRLGGSKDEIIAKTKKWTEQTLQLSRVLEIEATAGAEFVTEAYTKFGTKSEDALNQLASLRETTDSLTKSNGRLVVTTEDLAREVLDLSHQTENYSFDAREQGRVLANNIAYYQKLGYSTEVAAKKAKESSKAMLGDQADDLMKYNVGAKFAASLRGKTNEEMQTTLEQMGISDKAKQARIISLVNSKMNDLAKFSSVFKEFGGTEAQAFEIFKEGVVNNVMNPQVLEKRLTLSKEAAEDLTLKFEKADALFRSMQKETQDSMIKEYGSQDQALFQMWKDDISSVRSDNADEYARIMVAEKRRWKADVPTAESVIGKSASAMDAQANVRGDTAKAWVEEFINNPWVKTVGGVILGLGTMLAPLIASVGLQTAILTQVKGIAIKMAAGGSGGGDSSDSGGVESKNKRKAGRGAKGVKGKGRVNAKSLMRKKTPKLSGLKKGGGFLSKMSGKVAGAGRSVMSGVSKVPGVSKLTGGVSKLAGGAAKLASGAGGAIASSVSKLPGLSKLAGGAKFLGAGAAKLAAPIGMAISAAEVVSLIAVGEEERARQFADQEKEIRESVTGGVVDGIMNPFKSMWNAGSSLFEGAQATFSASKIEAENKRKELEIEEIRKRKTAGEVAKDLKPGSTQSKVVAATSAAAVAALPAALQAAPNIPVSSVPSFGSAPATSTTSSTSASAQAQTPFAQAGTGTRGIVRQVMQGGEKVMVEFEGFDQILSAYNLKVISNR